MKFALVGPGIIQIPPPGWGAVEILILEYTLALAKLGHEVEIINIIRKNPHDSQPGTTYTKTLIEVINNGNFDVVHVHYDCLWHILPHIKCGKKAITSHYPYIDKPEKYRMDGFEPIFQGLCDNDNHLVFALSKKDYNVIVKAAKRPGNVLMALNGANPETIFPVEQRTNAGRSIYLAKVEPRKNQHKYYTLDAVDFYGQCKGTQFEGLPQFKGELLRKDFAKVLSSYGNMVLLSSGEGTPLVIKEAMMAGLPVVTNSHSVSDLPDLDFVDVIPDDKLDDIEYINKVIAQNQEKQTMSTVIRQYAVENFSWDMLVKIYIDRLISSMKGI